MSLFSAAADTASCVLDSETGLPIIIGGVAHIVYQSSRWRDALVELMLEATRPGAGDRVHHRVRAPKAAMDKRVLDLKTSVSCPGRPIHEQSFRSWVSPVKCENSVGHMHVW